MKVVLNVCVRLTRRLVHPLFNGVFSLMDPLAVTLKVDLSGRRGRAVQIDTLVFDDVSVFRLQQEVREGFWRVAGEGLRELAQSQQKVIIC